MKEAFHQFLDAIIVFGGAAALWVSGEAGRTMIAGGAGAVVRWWASEKRTLRNGVIQTISGAVVAMYMWPLVFAILHYFIPSLDKDAETIAASAFIAGMMGISVAKIGLAIVENFGRQHQPTDKGGSDRG